MPSSWAPPGFQGSNIGGVVYPPAAPNYPVESSSSALADIPIQNIPKVVNWFSYLDQHPQHNQNEITYVPFGPMLKKQGFFRISQLTGNHVGPDHLVRWLGIEFGVAVLIFQYVEQDLVVIRSGKLILMDT
jgi:hypothetical protein